jgi:hypothetical protein
MKKNIFKNQQQSHINITRKSVARKNSEIFITPLINMKEKKNHPE